MSKWCGQHSTGLARSPGSLARNSSSTSAAPPNQRASSPSSRPSLPSAWGPLPSGCAGSSYGGLRSPACLRPRILSLESSQAPTCASVLPSTWNASSTLSPRVMIISSRGMRMPVRTSPPLAGSPCVSSAACDASQENAEWLSSGTALRFARAARLGHCSAWCASWRAPASAAGGVRPSLDQSNRITCWISAVRTIPDCAPGMPRYAGVLSFQGKAARGGAMQVSEILKVKGNALFTIAPDGKLREAVSVMAENNMGSLVVMEKGRMVGILTFREILMALDKGRGALGEARVGEIMERDPVIASPGMDVNDLRRTMIDSGARYLPVMERDRLIGVISFRDVAKAVLEEQDFENRMLKGYIKNWPE